ncbi:SDR family NAD(P)-dependent oxidoreductase [bacterium]|nr:SDR family NAD(P)-dependent oxidoreductase [bacterium]
MVRRLKILITGGCGFIGCNAAKRFIDKGYEVAVLDNLSRKGSKDNLEWLKQQGEFEFINCDIRDYAKIKKIFAPEDLRGNSIDVVLHLAAQVAVTTSVLDPREDFQINALGTFNLLEAVKENRLDPIFIYASTNKVYGGMTDIKVIERNGRYEYESLPEGISEERILDFHSPYGCSKGAADQYVRDYSRIYGLRTVVMRQSCIYGYRQFGVEDQGWVAWFTIAASMNKPITIYGDGKQVRDVLFIDDLVDAYEKAIENIETASGKIYNIGGGPNNKMSLLELISFLERFLNKKIEYSFSDWRPGDQPVFVCSIEKARKELAWQPKIDVENGVKKLSDWVKKNRFLFEC